MYVVYSIQTVGMFGRLIIILLIWSYMAKI
nr:MAG TPA: hypothetical protein [Caudoviricetes sp.]